CVSAAVAVRTDVLYEVGADRLRWWPVPPDAATVPNLGGLPWVRLPDGPAPPLHEVLLPPADPLRWRAERRLLHAAWLVGAAAQALGMARAHLSERQQF